MLTGPQKTSFSYLVLYGSLMSSFRTQEKLGLSNRMSLVGPCSLYGKLYDLGDYPGFKLDSTTKQLVSAELYRFSDEKILSVLDEFEGYKASNEEGSLYKRALIKLQESSITAWCIFIIELY